MAAEEQDEIRFQTCRCLYGSLQFVGTYRRNGKTTLNLGPDWRSIPLETEPKDDSEPPLQLPDDLYFNLTTTEKRTWQKILDAKSIEEIATEEGVSRTAIYERIRGNGRKQGGMIRKNRWMARWWNERHKLKNHVHDD